MADHFELATELIEKHATGETNGDGIASVNVDTLADAFASRIEELVGLLRAVQATAHLPLELDQRVGAAIVNAETTA